MQKLLGASWKTTIFGWLGLVAAGAIAGQAVLSNDSVNWIAFSEAIVIVFPSLAAIFARDNKVSSESAGAR
tara:strand:+ start:129 stop:341 length:213 start_codon:yes stop_codon:yes gene_type:complete